MPRYEATAATLGLGSKKRASSPLEMIALVERGIPIAALDRLSKLVAPDDAVFKYRIVSRPTLDRRRKRAGGRLSPEESERLARLARVWALAREVWGSEIEAR